MKQLRLLALAGLVALAGCGSTFEDYESTQSVDTMYMNDGIGSIDVLSVDHHDWLGDVQWYGYRFVAWNSGSHPLCVRIILEGVRASGSQWGDAVFIPVGGSATVAEVWSYPGTRVTFGSQRAEYKQVTNRNQCYF